MPLQRKPIPLIKKYKVAREYLDGFINYEKKVKFSYKQSCKLERVKALLNALDIDYKKVPAIHADRSHT